MHFTKPLKKSFLKMFFRHTHTYTQKCQHITSPSLFFSIVANEDGETNSRPLARFARKYVFLRKQQICTAQPIFYVLYKSTTCFIFGRKGLKWSRRNTFAIIFIQITDAFILQSAAEMLTACLYHWVCMVMEILEILEMLNMISKPIKAVIKCLKPVFKLPFLKTIVK